MAVNKILFGVALLQIITSLSSIALCSRHYSDTTNIDSKIEHVAVKFTSRFLPTLSLLVCGIMGLIISHVTNQTARIVHTTATTQTSIGLAVNIWYFAFHSSTSPMIYDQSSALNCLISTTCCLFICVTYLVYSLITWCKEKESPSIEEACITDDLESNKIDSKPKSYLTIETLQVPVHGV